MPVIIDSPVPPSMPESTVTVEEIINKVSYLLNDEDNVRWTREELLGWVNDAQVAIVKLKPGANNKIVAMKLQPGARQAIPDDGWLLLEITRNLGSDGSTPGQMIQLVSRDLLNRFNMSWYSDTNSAVTKNYMFTLQDQPSFYVYPPSDGTGYVEVNYSFFPPELTDEDDVISIRDIYYTAIIDYVAYKALMKDSEEGANGQIAERYYSAFMAELSIKDEGEKENNPNVSRAPTNAAVRGAAK